MVAFVAGPILYAQQKPISANELQNVEVLNTEQSKASQSHAIQSQANQGKKTPASGAAFNVSDTKGVNKKSTPRNSEAKTTRKDNKASSFKTTVEN